MLRAGGKLLLCGNGGSAADGQHIATELTVRFETDAPRSAAIALTTDTSALTAASNDLGFDRVFARQVEALGRPGDMLIALSTSGNSPNIVAALCRGPRRGLAPLASPAATAARSPPSGLADHCLVVPADNTARIQEVHIFLGHLLCAAVDDAFTPGGG